MKMTIDDLTMLEVTTTENGGFTVWCSELVRGKPVRHWILDGSMIKEDQEIRLGNPKLYKLNAVYKKKTNSIILCRRAK